MDPTSAFDSGVPAFGTWVLYAFLVSASCAFALSIFAATADRKTSPRLLHAARMAALGTCALIALDVLLLLYAFMSHDFRVRYVSHYSDRSMPSIYLITALWGGQDGSLLWWTFLLSLYSSACILWLRGRYRELAPYVIATLMGIVMFFGVLMAFAANPFAANVAGGPPDGEGLNPSLQNFYMAIHPPSLYTGFVGCSVPFAFAIAALLSGRLDEEWIRAVRKWALFAWVFLSIGNTLGMLWAYEELGWGGFWAWDPVENAACLPWFTCTAFLHSAMIQERRASLKVWNVSLIMLTYLLTIFGTFLTRSGLIASIHSFAQSDVGIFFVYYMAFLVALCVALIAYRYPRLKSDTEIDSVLSREAMFVANNWLLLGICMFVCVATTWPKISEWLWNERLTVGASFYNFWLPVPGATLLALMAIGTLTPWRKASTQLIWRSVRWPLAVGFAASIVHVLVGRRLGFPAYSYIEPIYPSAVGRTVSAIDSRLPAVFSGLAMANLVAIGQEYWRGTQARMHAKHEGTAIALVNLVARNRRRYGGYIAHIGIVLMFFGWTGPYWRIESEGSLRPGEALHIGHYALRYDGVETRRDPNKRMVFAHVTVFHDGQNEGMVTPAKFIYTTHPEMPTSEVSISTHMRSDLYVVLASLNANTHVAHLKAFVNPLVVWIWLGCFIFLTSGAVLGMWPEASLEAERSTVVAAPAPAHRVGSAGTTGAALLALFALGSALLLRTDVARAQGHTMSQPPPVGGNAEMMTPTEQHMFERMICMCGGCQRLSLATCTCDFAAAQRESMRQRLREGLTPDQVVQRYVARWGPEAMAVPPDAGHNRGLYAIPIAVIAVAGALGVRIVRRWRLRTATVAAAAAPGAVARADYDKLLDEELRGLDE